MLRAGHEPANFLGHSSEGLRVPVARRHGSMRRVYSAVVFNFHHLSVKKWEEGVRLPPSSLAFARIIPGANQVSRFIHTAACTYGVSSTTAFLRKRHHFPADFAFDLFRLVHVDAQLGRRSPPIPPRSTAKPLRTSLRLRWLSPAALRRFARSGVTTLH